MSSKNLSDKEGYDLSYPEGKDGFTTTQLTVSILLLVLIVAIAVVGFKIVVAKADRITLQHDLENFVKAQDIFRTDNKHYLGKAGDFIEYGTPPRVSWL